MRLVPTLLALTITAVSSIVTAGEFDVGLLREMSQRSGNFESKKVQSVPWDRQQALTDESVRDALFEVAESFGWAIVHEDLDNGMYIWRFRLMSLFHLPFERRFAWKVIRSGNELVFYDPVTLEPISSPRKETIMQTQKEMRLLQEEFKKRLLTKVQGVKLTGLQSDQFSVEEVMEAMVQSLQLDRSIRSQNQPPVVGDELLVIADSAKVEVDGKAVAMLPFGHTVTVRGFAGDRIRIEGRRPGSVDRRDVVSLNEGEQMLTQLLHMRGNDATLYSVRGIARILDQLYQGSHEFELAFADLNQAVQMNPRDPLVYHRRGLCWGLAGKAENAIADFDVALQLAPEFSEFYNDRGNAYLRSGDLRAALEDLARAIEIDPKYALAYNNRAAVWIQARDYRRAYDDLCKAIELDPYLAKAYFNRALARLKLDHGEEELSADLQSAIRLDPTYLSYMAAE